MKQRFANHRDLGFFEVSFNGPLIVESDSSSAIRWVIHVIDAPWNFSFILNEIIEICKCLDLKFQNTLGGTK